MNFVAMDFETASGKRWSACSLSLVVVRQNQIVDEFYTLINPQTPFSGATFRSMAFMKKTLPMPQSFLKSGSIFSHSLMPTSW